MNIHFQQAEKKSQVFFYMLAAVAVFTVSMLILNIGWHSEFRLYHPFTSRQGAFIVNNTMPFAIPAPLPPAEHLQAIATPIPSSTPSPLPQAVAAPVPVLQ